MEANNSNSLNSLSVRLICLLLYVVSWFSLLISKWPASIIFVLSYSTRLNAGLKFPFANNRKHNFYIWTSYNLNKHWNLAANLFLTSGRSTTLNETPPISSPSINPDEDDNPLFDDDDDDDEVGSLSTKPNNFRLTPYSRLDLSVGYKNSIQTANGIRTIACKLSVYNAYAHKNTYFAYRTIDPVTHRAAIKQVSFIPVIPSLSIEYTF